MLPEPLPLGQPSQKKHLSPLVRGFIPFLKMECLSGSHTAHKKENRDSSQVIGNGGAFRVSQVPREASGPEGRPEGRPQGSRTPGLARIILQAQVSQGGLAP